MAKIRDLLIPKFLETFVVPESILDFYEKHKTEQGDNLLLCRSSHFGFFFVKVVTQSTGKPGIVPVWFEKNLGDKNRFFSIISREKAYRIREKTTDAIASNGYSHYSRMRVDGLQNIIGAGQAAKIIYNESAKYCTIVNANPDINKA